MQWMLILIDVHDLSVKEVTKRNMSKHTQSRIKMNEGKKKKAYEYEGFQLQGILGHYSEKAFSIAVCFTVIPSTVSFTIFQHETFLHMYVCMCRCIFVRIQTSISIFFLKSFNFQLPLSRLRNFYFFSKNFHDKDESRSGSV